MLSEVFGYQETYTSVHWIINSSVGYSKICYRPVMVCTCSMGSMKGSSKLRTGSGTLLSTASRSAKIDSLPGQKYVFIDICLNSMIVWERQLVDPLIHYY